MRIALIGKMGAGKDTIADYLVDKHGFCKYAFADKLKEISRELFPSLYETKRRWLLQTVGTEMRKIDPNCWTNYLMRKLEVMRNLEKHYSQPEARIVISDMRFRDEAIACRKNGFKIVRVVCDWQIRHKRLIERDGVRPSPGEEYHRSEIELDAYPEDYIIYNRSDTFDLYNNVNLMLKELFGFESGTAEAHR